MSILIGVNHIATVSSNLDDLIDFYDRIFDAKVLVDIEIPDMVLKSDPTPGRHAFISIGGPSILHAWQIDGVDPARFDGEIFDRGRVDHFSLQAGTYADFEKLRESIARQYGSQPAPPASLPSEHAMRDYRNTVIKLYGPQPPPADTGR